MAWRLVDRVAAPTAATQRGRARAARFVLELERELSAMEGDVVVAGRASDLSAIAVGEFDAIRKHQGRVGIFCAWLRDDDEPSAVPDQARQRPKTFIDACSPDAADVVVFAPFLADPAPLRSMVTQAAERFPSARITCLVGASAVDAGATASQVGQDLGREVLTRTAVRSSGSAAGRRHAELVRANAARLDDGFPPIVAIELLYDSVGRPKAA